MTIPPGIKSIPRKVSDMVREMVPRFRQALSEEEAALGLHLRGNAALLEALTNLLRTRIEGRAQIPAPTDLLVCKAMIERDREIQWIISRLEYIHASPVAELEQSDREQPA
jgi:hypothetical protein